MNLSLLLKAAAAALPGIAALIKLFTGEKKPVDPSQIRDRAVGELSELEAWKQRHRR